jgi:hypothetical protein
VLVRLPGPAPLGLEGGAVAGEQLACAPSGTSAPEAALAVVVHEHVLATTSRSPLARTRSAQSSSSNRPGAEALVEPADPVEDVPPEGRAEHGEDRQVEHLAGVRARPVLRRCDQLAVRRPGRRDLGLVAAAVGDRSDGADLGVAQVADRGRPASPAARRCRC